MKELYFINCKDHVCTRNFYDTKQIDQRLEIMANQFLLSQSVCISVDALLYGRTVSPICENVKLGNRNRHSNGLVAILYAFFPVTALLVSHRYRDKILEKL
jgi:hypothetical protein